MAYEITHYQVYSRDKNDILHQMDIEATDDHEDNKTRIAAYLRYLKDQGNTLYYYVVTRFRRDDGTFGYRTQVPKTVWGKEKK